MSSFTDPRETASVAFPVHALGVHYTMSLPQAATDYIQKKIADTQEPYEREMLEEMASRLAPDDLVVDVGANVGNHTIFLAAVAKCRVVAFEPHAVLAAAIAESARQNGLTQRVQVHRMGAGAVATSATLDEDNPTNLGAQKLSLGAGDVEVVPLDQLAWPAKVRAIKIDVEGMELDVLRGAEQLISRDRPLLYIESFNDQSFRPLCRWLEPRGYVCWDTFNATPTHLFMPGEQISLDLRLTRLQDKTFHETYRTGLLLTSVRSRLSQALEAERGARDRAVQAKVQAAALASSLSAVERELGEWKKRHAEEAAGRHIAERAVEQMEQRLRHAESTQQAAQQALKNQAQRLMNEQQRLRSVALQARRSLGELREEHDRVLGSLRFRIGSALADARSPAGLVRLPVRLWRAWRQRARPRAAAAPSGRSAGSAAATSDGPAPSEPVRCRTTPPPSHRGHPLEPGTWRIAALCDESMQSLLAPECQWELLPMEAAALPAPEGLDVLLVDVRLLPAAAGPDTDRWVSHLRQAAEAGTATVLWAPQGPDELPAAQAWAERVHVVVTDDLDAGAVWRQCAPHAQVALWPPMFQPREVSPFIERPDGLPAVAEIPVADAQAQSKWAPALWSAIMQRQIPVAGYSRALHLLWGELVVSTDSPDERERRLRRWLDDPRDSAAREAAAILQAWREHRVETRLAALRKLLWPEAPIASEPSIAVVAAVSDWSEVEQAARHLAAQGIAAELYCIDSAGVLGGDAAVANAGMPVRVLPDSHALQAAWQDRKPSWVAVLDPHRPWPADGLRGLCDAARWSGADGAVLADAVDASPWSCREMQAPWSATVVTHEVAQASLVASMSEPGRWSVQGRLAVVPIVARPQGMRVGQPLDELVRLLSGVLVPQGEPLDVSPAVYTPVKDWAAWLPADRPCDMQWTLAPDGLHVEWKGAHDRVEYVYLEHQFDVQGLKPGGPSLMQLEGQARGDVRAVLVFYGPDGRKISHVMHPAGLQGQMQVPPGATTARIALRFQRQSQARLGDLVLGRPRLPPRLPVATAPVLLIAKQYPSYEDLYRFGFVHSRVRGYRAQGLEVDVFRLSNEARGRFREYEGVGVAEGDGLRLRMALSSGQYKTVLVHYMDRHVWAILREYLDRVRVIIWVHGAEIQPWWRRAVNHGSDAERDKARRSSDERLTMWREVLSTDSDQLRLVFVSAKQAGEAFADLGTFPPADRYRVISNFIDEELFPYRPKTPEHRRHILSIRPYASAIYANDLAVQAILKLAQWPGFDQLRFRFIGDGPLFDVTVAPLRQFGNVTLEKRFLSQRDISEVHRDFGIFLVPSRMDSQGVSRDEAMSSGLVPISSRVAAIPEFVTAECAILAEPEDANGLAAGILALQDDPDRFLRMSAAAAAHVRSRSDRAHTVDAELNWILGRPTEVLKGPIGRRAHHVVVCGDLNLNVMDGSAVWAASLAETLSLLPDVGVTLFCKARIHRTQVISRLLDLTPQVRLVEPSLPDRARTLDVAGMLDGLEAIDREHPVDAWLLRGFDLCSQAAARPAFRGRLWAYLTDIPQRDEDINPDNHARVARIIESCRVLLCQTPQFEMFVHRHWPAVREKTRILSPMVPPAGRMWRAHLRSAPFRVAYAGKFAPLWGIRELFRSFDILRRQHPQAELHVYGDKIHNPVDDPGYRDEIRSRLEAGGGVQWHGSVDRAQLMQALGSMDVCWAYRDPAFERETHELSTKVLEYASIGVPIIVARSAPNEEALGGDYPLFASSEAEAAQLLCRLAESPELGQSAARTYADLAQRYSFSAVAESLLQQGLLSILAGDHA